jgi:hypothetical protein
MAKGFFRLGVVEADSAKMIQSESPELGGKK